MALPCSSRTWMWKTEAPASAQERMSDAISSGVIGTAAYADFVGTAPVGATLMIIGR
jgi:hypothetical protein